MPADAGFTTLELSTNFVRAITHSTGRVYAEGRVVHGGGRVVTTEARVYDDAGHVVRAREVDMPGSEERTMKNTGNETTTETLRIDDTELTIRPITIADAERLARLFGRLSPSSVHFRFFSPIARPPRGALLRLADVDHARRDALVALDGDEIVAVARYDGRLNDDRSPAGQAEIAITVEDAWQHRGLGKRLAKRLADPGRGAGLRQLRRDDAARQPGRARPRPQARSGRDRAVGGRRVRSRHAARARELTRATAEALPLPAKPL